MAEEARPVCYVFFARLRAMVIRVCHDARGSLCVRARREKEPRASSESRKSARVTGQVLWGGACLLWLCLFSHALLRRTNKDIKAHVLVRYCRQYKR